MNDQVESLEQELNVKEKEIKQFVRKIIDQEKEMAELQAELDAQHYISEQLSMEKMREVEKKSIQLNELVISRIKLKLRLRKQQNENNHLLCNLKRAQMNLQYYKSMIVS